jgi:SAM-dependent methyltransferase
VVLDAVPAGAKRALDVGCGDGVLARKLARVVPQVMALDKDVPSLSAARDADGGLGVQYVPGDFLTYDLEPGSFDFICSVAALHHMDAAVALARMRELLRPGGRLAIIGLARPGSVLDLPAEAAGIAVHRLHVLVLRQPYLKQTAPTAWPPPTTYGGLRRIAAAELPDAQFRRRVLWRYSLTWTRPVP